MRPIRVDFSNGAVVVSIGDGEDAIICLTPEEAGHLAFQLEAAIQESGLESRIRAFCPELDL